MGRPTEFKQTDSVVDEINQLKGELEETNKMLAWLFHYVSVTSFQNDPVFRDFVVQEFGNKGLDQSWHFSQGSQRFNKSFLRRFIEFQNKFSQLNQLVIVNDETVPESEDP